MKIVLYSFALVAGAFGLYYLFRAIETSLAGGGLDFVRFVIGIVGIFLAALWVMRARNVK